MDYSNWHLYTVAKGERFIDSAVRCALSFINGNPGLKFTIFVMDDSPLVETENIKVKHITCPEYFTPAILEKKPCADILFFKFADAPFMLEGDEKYIGQIDADCLCMKSLPFQNFIEDLDAGKFCVASDPKVEVNKKEIEEYYKIDWKLYFNSGVCFWRRNVTRVILGGYASWVIEHIDDLAKIQYADQTWMNIFMNNPLNEMFLSEIGWYWNFRGCVKHPRAYIWHAGGRDSEGIEVLKKEFESWK